MPFAKLKKDRPQAPVCKACEKEMIVTLRVPLTYAPGFEDVLYECSTCKAEIKVTALPI